MNWTKLTNLRALAGTLGVALALLLGGASLAQTDELQDVNQMLRNGQLDQALARVNSFLNGKPKDARGRFLKGLILAEQNKANDAIKMFSDLTTDFPELPGPYNNLAVLYAAQGQYDKARDSLERAIRTHPSYATAHENLGDIYAKMASQAYDRALQLDKNNATAQTKLNLIRDLFPADARQRPPTTPVAAKGEPPRVAAATPAAPATPATTTKPEPAAPAATAKPTAAPAGGRDSGAVQAAVAAWAKAWSEKDVPGYLAAYGPDFKPAGGGSRGAWEAERKQRISAPRSIQVTLDNVNVEFDDSGNRATVNFRQDYRSDALKSVNSKTLVMTKSGDKWLILQERSGG